VIAWMTVVAAFAGMELVSYASHRWLMHGPAMGWHRSHHRPAAGRFEKNDLFPLVFSVIGAGAFGAAAVSERLVTARWVGLGMALYGAAYLVVHDIVIHRRLALPIPDWRYISWVRRCHRVHHLYGGEPYGMLAPFVPRALRSAAAVGDLGVLERSSRPMRQRL
jgi:beta-carotene 3-hydroxylase